MQAEEILNKKSGWKALTAATDFSEISSSQDPKCKLAFDILVDRIIGFSGSYYVKVEGQVDALVFAGGIGEKAALLRTRVVEKCRCLGFELDRRTNNNAIEYGVRDIGKEGTRHRTLVCQTNEQVNNTHSSPPSSSVELAKFKNRSKWRESALWDCNRNEYMKE